MKTKRSTLGITIMLLFFMATSAMAQKEPDIKELEDQIQQLESSSPYSAILDSIRFKLLLLWNYSYRTGSSLCFDSIPAKIKSTQTSQSPSVFVLDCIDSRVIPELCFRQTIGRIFTGRSAGNMPVSDMNGSISYAVNFKHVSCIIVLGHTNCGAVQGGIDYWRTYIKKDTVAFSTKKAGPDLTSLVKRIADNAVKTVIDKDSTGKFKPYASYNQAFVDEVARQNIFYSANVIQAAYPSVHVFRALYSTYTGKVEPM